MKNKYVKIASIIEILTGLVIGGFGGYICLICSVTSGPTAIFGVIVGAPLIFLSILLIIFGINLWQLKKWAWLSSIITLVIAIALFAVLGTGHPVYFLGSIGAAICLILLILERIKKGEINIPQKKVLIIMTLIMTGTAGYYLSRNLQWPVSLPVIPPKFKKSVDSEVSGYETYKHEIYGYDMISSEIPILRIIVFDDRNENGIMDSNEKGLQNIHLDESWGDMAYFGGSLTPENGIVNFYTFPLYQKITIFLSTANHGKYWGWQTVFEEGWPITTVDKYEFTLTEIPEETKIIYFGLKKIEELTVSSCQNECSQAGLKRCPDNNYQICGDYDANACLEWSSITLYSSEKICKDGSCIFKKDILI